jgi:hypothetical protein
MMIDSIGSSFMRTPGVEQSGAAYMGNLAPMQPAAVQPSNFTEMLAGMIGDTAMAVKSAESTAIQAVHGKANIQPVAEAA